MNQERQNFNIISETPKENGKREDSSDQQIVHKPHAVKRPISEICGESDQGISIFSKEDAEFLDSLKDLNKPSDEIALGESNLEGINSELPDIVESRSHNQENNALSILESTSSNRDILLNCADGKVADIDEFKGIKKLLIYDAPTLSGPSCIREYNYNSNLCAETTKMISSPNLQRVEKMERKPVMCSACKQKDISEHFEISEGENLYKCCDCKYTTGNYESLVHHILNIHPPLPFYCEACKVYYSEKSLHGIPRQCKVCYVQFGCKILLEDHYLRHEDRHIIFCRICKKEISKHTFKRDGRTVYKCCESRCLYESKKLHNFRTHLYRHSDLKIFKCNECGNRFKHEKSLLKHSETHT